MSHTDRDAVIEELKEVRKYAEYKAMGDGRIRDAETDRVRVSYLNLIVRACDSEIKALKDKELDELAEQLDRVEGRLGVEA